MININNLSQVNEYLSPEFIAYLTDLALNIINQNMRFKTYQSRWVYLNLQALQKLYTSPKLSDEKKKQISDISNIYAKSIPLKMDGKAARDSVSDIPNIVY